LNTDRGARQDDAAHALGLGEQVLDRQDGAPAMPVQMDLAKAQGLPDSRDLLDESVDRPEGGIRGAGGPSRAQLIVEDDRPLIRQRGQGAQIRARHAGTAVQDEQRRLRPAPDDAVPDPPPRDLDPSLAGTQPPALTSDRRAQGERENSKPETSLHGRDTTRAKRGFQYLGMEGSTDSAQALIPPVRFRTFRKPASWTICRALRLRPPMRQ